MMILKAEGLVKEWKGHRIFENVDLEVKDRSRLALIGANGVGKTTLLQGLIGRIALDGGRIYRRIPPSDWGLLEQDPETSEKMTLLDFLETGDPVRAEAKRELRYRERAMIQASQRELPKQVDLYGIALDRYQSLDGYKWEKELEQTALRFGLKEECWKTPFPRLSGGQKTRAQLARMMMQKPAFLLMDEPTNHLDEKTLSDLEIWLADYPGAVLFVSHDRTFIDRIAEETVEFFVRIYFSEANLLVLDEPTNYLDIPTRERMEEALKAYPGTLVIVSHDRHLLRKISNCVADIQDGTITYFPGGYEEYRQRQGLKNWEQSDPDFANRIRELELKRAQLVGEEGMVHPDDEEQRLKEIRRLTTELEALKKEADL
ncbi:ATP-binding cassette domain-containing protein [Kroppenstedtia pulmonis]|uniref:ATP-binding cassette domain-containing protein n=1 Tax=Kroppenstedtia pulmonis TaxID=1380685 RepID=A0A7D4CUZ2_9BACL|nr:ATP-binding cassette domain-containing protein [Kroppenstedtia pulmonis]QKG83817.1 ATP-binding cassette domain-containing protein [Kroppenstedtia pulmonis]